MSGTLVSDSLLIYLRPTGCVSLCTKVTWPGWALINAIVWLMFTPPALQGDFEEVRPWTRLCSRRVTIIYTSFTHRLEVCSGWSLISKLKKNKKKTIPCIANKEPKSWQHVISSSQGVLGGI